MATLQAIYTTGLAALGGSLMIAASAQAEAFPGASGMAVLDDTHLLIVQDVKIGQPGEALGVLAILPEGGYDYTPLRVDWPERPANDLESCCALQDRPGEYLVAESGSYHEVWYDAATELYAGRIFHLQVEPTGDGWTASVLNTLPIPLDLHEVEGMVVVAEQTAREWSLFLGGPSQPMNSGSRNYDSGYRTESHQTRPLPPPDATPDPPADVATADYILVLATRGGAVAYEQARLHWGHADLARGTLTYDANDSLPLFCEARTPAAWLRGCSDLYLDEAGVIWVATAQDFGDAGPFRSNVYRFGELRAVLQSDASWLPAYALFNGSTPPVVWEVAGVKIEALGAPLIDGGVLSYATDDEGYGGIWRTLGEAR